MTEANPNSTPSLQMHIDSDGIALLTFNRPEAHNALDLVTMHAFANAVEQLYMHLEDLRAVIVTGAGDRAFCSGADLDEMRYRNTEADAREMSAVMGDALLRLERLPVPVIAAINGFALGGGSEVALACDLRFADERVKMGFVHMNMAVTPSWGAGQRLQRLVGYAQALQIFLESQTMRAQDLAQLHLVNAVTERHKALDYAMHYARQIAAKPADTVRGMKAMLQIGLQQSYEEALTFERELFTALWASPAHDKAVEAFFSKSFDKQNERRNGQPSQDLYNGPDDADSAPDDE
ncbi:enoyl-CoA hydratase/isomerase family protein [Phototrophicus methaneseepsis]|uniref:Ethylmalonyl-CoA decarboxylase n=1 Tax=Phototrophicus methaneseepsis TaxID=2710758 RepID=A0A7S8E869_9CHLR|nr:enoyl-CoA hydratase/isomerase family protein [Phototrophicus methaneseepsis]QPC82149.1 enoyl-CoA hydratase/isomerase family protein [Phototrophicus methaneseepsis]